MKAATSANVVYSSYSNLHMEISQGNSLFKFSIHYANMLSAFHINREIELYAKLLILGNAMATQCQAGSYMLIFAG